MKSKAKFDPKVIQQFFVDHTEKLVIGLVAALFLYFIYQSTLLDHYKESPEKLQTATRDASDKIGKGPANMDEKLRDLVKNTNYKDKIDQFKMPIDPGKYPVSVNWTWRVDPRLHLRVSPRIIAPTKLRAIPGRGAIADGNGTRGMRWIVLTGLVPYKDQLAEYSKTFAQATAYDPVKDVPKYIGYFVQRAEVVAGATGEPKWKLMIFPPRDASDPIARLGSQMAEEVADPRFILPMFASPLPMSMGNTWGTEAVSPPQIPVVEREVANPDAPRDSAPFMGPPPRGMRDRGGQLSTAAMDRIRGGRGGPMAPSTAGPSITGGWGDVPEVPDPTKHGPDGAAAQDEEAQPSDYLLRFFDFDVKPNKQYEYRIFLVLENPNYKLEPGVLEDPKVAEYRFVGIPTPQPVRSADGEISWPTDPKYADCWSKTCTSSRVSGDIRVLCGPVVAARGAQDPSAEVRVLRWQELSGLNGTCTKDGLIRGTLLNFPQVVLRNSGSSRTMMDPRPAPEDLNTNSALIDMLGGERLPDRESRLTSPGMILVLDPSGFLVMHDQVAETKEWDEATKVPEGQGIGPRNPPRGRPVPPGRVDPTELDTNPSSRRRPAGR
jgi:hypothetical protein